VYGLTRGTMTLLGVAAAGFLLWLASQLEADGNGEYWTQMGLLAGAGLVMALSQLLGGWTKWGWPRISPTVFLIGFLPALAAGGLVLLAAQPDSSAWGTGWAADLGVSGLAEDLTGVLPAIAFLVGLTFGFTFDTTGPRVDDDVDVVEEHAAVYPVDRTATDEPVTAERRRLRRDHDTVVDDGDRVRDRDRVLAADGTYVGDRDRHDGDGWPEDRDREHTDDRAVHPVDDHPVDERAAHEEQPRRRGLFRR
jgi:hypothetical protein